MYHILEKRMNHQQDTPNFPIQHLEDVLELPGHPDGDLKD